MSRLSLFPLRFLLKLLGVLKDHPVLYRGRSFQIVGFGVFAALEAMALTSVFYVYLFAKGVDIRLLGPWQMLLAAVSVWLGAKVMHWIALGEKFLRDPVKYMTETGFYMQGGVAGAIVWLAGTSMWAGVPYSMLADGLTWGAMAGQVFGRLGCFNYGCCFGKTCSHTLGVRYINPESKILRWRNDLSGVPVLPTQLYMAGTNAFMFVLIALLIPLGLPNGVITVVFLVWHGATRMWIETLRGDIIHDEGRNWTTFRLAAMLMAVGALFWFTGPLFGAAWGETVPLANPFKFGSVVLLLDAYPELVLLILALGMLIMLGYGIHGKDLGTFPFAGTFRRLQAARNNEQSEFEFSGGGGK